MKISELKGTQRDLIVTALQALYRERKNAYLTTFTACSLAGKEIPPEDIFGIDEVMSALREIGAMPN